MTRIQYYTDHGDYQRIFVWFCQLIIGIIIFLTTLLVLVWGIYFACRVREFGKKVHYLKKQTDERCQEELTNARVELINYIFLTVICLTEVIGFAYYITNLILHSKIPTETHHCPGDNLINEIRTEPFIRYSTGYSVANEIRSDPFIRYSIAISVSCILIYTSLIHILTSYMANAYAVKRVVELSRRVKLLFLLLFTQLAVVWLSVFEWKAFVIILLLAAITVFPIHIFFFFKFSRKLYTSLKRRTLDAWFEDTQQHETLKRMCREYKRYTICYGVSIVMIGLTLCLRLIETSTQMVFKDSCWLDELLGVNKSFHWLNDVYKQNNQTFDIFRDVYTISYNVFAVFSVLSLFLLNASILYNAIMRLYRRRRAYNSYTGTRFTEMNRPLIGNK